MATNAVNIGKGRASGMFLTAASGTALPATLSETTLSAWGSVVGYVSDEGMTLNLSRDKENIKDWANVVRRVVLTDHEETASGSCISTTADALAALFGASAVTTETGTTTSTTTVNLSASDLPAAAAFLFVMVDGDDVLAFGCSEGQISVSDNVSFAPGDAIEWPFEVTAMGEGGMKFIKTAGAAG